MFVFHLLLVFILIVYLQVLSNTKKEQQKYSINDLEYKNSSFTYFSYFCIKTCIFNEDTKNRFF